VLLRADGTPQWAVKELGTALGFECNLKFDRSDLSVQEGDTLVLYTDGVSEAFNGREECYGNERLLADAVAFASKSAPDLSSGLLPKVRAFAGTAPQSDDIAILTMRIGGDSKRLNEAGA